MTTSPKSGAPASQKKKAPLKDNNARAKASRGAYETYDTGRQQSQGRFHEDDGAPQDIRGAEPQDRTEGGPRNEDFSDDRDRQQGTKNR